MSKRELFGLILLAQLYTNDTGNLWHVGYAPNQTEPNDGFISDGSSKRMIEHKVVAQMDKQEALPAILCTYAKYHVLGVLYGANRTLLIHANKASTGLIKISELRDAIKENCPFDEVLLIHAVKSDGQTAVMHITQHFPPDTRPHFPGKEISQIDFDMASGSGIVSRAGVEID